MLIALALTVLNSCLLIKMNFQNEHFYSRLRLEKKIIHTNTQASNYHTIHTCTKNASEGKTNTKFFSQILARKNLTPGSRLKFTAMFLMIKQSSQSCKKSGSLTIFLTYGNNTLSQQSQSISKKVLKPKIHLTNQNLK